MSFGSYYNPMRPSQVALVVKNPPANTGDIRDAGLIPGWGKEMTTHSSILAWRIPWTEEPGGLQSIGLQSQTRLKQLSTHMSMRMHIHTESNEVDTVTVRILKLKLREVK